MKENTKIFFRYVLIGFFATLIDVSLLYILTEFFNIWYLYSASVSYLVAVVPHYVLNKYFNFKNKNKRIFSQFSIFLIISLSGLLLTQIILYVLVELFNIWYMFSKGVAIVLVLFYHYNLNKKITFKILI